MKIDVDFFTGISVTDEDEEYFRKERKREYNHKWHQENKEYHNALSRKWRQENKEYDNARSRSWYQENKEYHNARSHLWRQENKESHNTYNREWRAKRRKDKAIKSRKYRLYFLYNPQFPDDIKYVGLTSNTLRQRLIWHLKAPRKSNAQKYNWLFNMKESGIEVGITEFWPGLTIPDRREAEYLESMLIHECLRSNFTLLNIQGIPPPQQKFAAHLKSLDNNTPQGFFEQLFQIIKKVIDN